MDWTAFAFKYTLGKNFSEQLISIDGYRRAVERIVIPNAWKTKLNRLNRIRAIHGTTAIEGNLMSENQVRDFLEGASSASDSDKTLSMDQLQVQNAKRAQEWIRERSQSRHGTALRLEDLLHLHKLVTEGERILENVPGKLRTRSVIVGSEELGGVHRGAPHDQLPNLLKGFLEWLYSRKAHNELHPVERALLAHFFLVTIHPFRDGNGRVSRLIEAYLLLIGGYNIHGFYGLSNFFYKNANRYKMLLQHSRKSIPFDLTEFVEFGLGGFEDELKGINSFIQGRQNRLTYMDTLSRCHATKRSARRYVLSDREYTFLTQFVDKTNPIDPFALDVENRMSLSKVLSDPAFQFIYRGVSPRTFLRDIEKLRDKRFVKLQQENNETYVSIDLGAIEQY
ncbi:MAG: Fic family protein [Gammaproteobacteria bacterium]|nr:Fic family protein [Gammaproteobacteria bacterium]